MREAKIILPVADNVGNCIPMAHIALRDGLIGAFGGCTAWETRGWWRSDLTGRLFAERSITYAVAAEDEPGNYITLRRLALDAANAVRQETVYLVGFDGRAVILPVEPGNVPA